MANPKHKITSVKKAKDPAKKHLIPGFKTEGNPVKGVDLPSFDERSVSMMDKRLVKLYISQNFLLSEEQLEEKLQSPHFHAFEKSVIRLIQRSGYDTKFMTLLLDRIIGKVADEVTIADKRNKYEDMPLEEMLKEKEKIDKRNAETLYYLEKQKGLRDGSGSTDQ